MNGLGYRGRLVRRSTGHGFPTAIHPKIRRPFPLLFSTVSTKPSDGPPKGRYPPKRIPSASHHHSDRWQDRLGRLGFLATAGSALLWLDSPSSTSLEGPSEKEDASFETGSHRCTLSWVTASESTRADCRIYEPRSTTTAQVGSDPGFDPTHSAYYGVTLTPSTASTDGENTAAIDGTPSLLHNTIVVLPHLMTRDECRRMVDNAERILAEHHQPGGRTERWTLYERFDDDCQRVMDRVLGTSVLDFLEQRMPTVANQLFQDHPKYLRRSDPAHEPKAVEDLKEKVRYHWDDPVVIKYTAGNDLAPHEDMRPLTLVIPLNPLEDVPLGGGGTRFWLERPEDARANSGVSVRPRPGSGILLNGEITHSGNRVESGTRFVLMTSLTWDDPEDEIEWDDDDNGDDTVQ